MTYQCNAVTSTYHCAQGLQYEWWGLWFSFFMIVATLVTALRHALSR